MAGNYRPGPPANGAITIRVQGRAAYAVRSFCWVSTKLRRRRAVTTLLPPTMAVVMIDDPTPRKRPTTGSALPEGRPGLAFRSLLSPGRGLSHQLRQTCACLHI